MNDEELEDLLRVHDGSAAPRFAAGFTDRVMRRLHGRETMTLDRALERQARRVLPALAAASLVLAAWNYVSHRDRAPSAIGAVLGVASTNAGVMSNPATIPATELLNVEAFQ